MFSIFRETSGRAQSRREILRIGGLSALGLSAAVLLTLKGWRDAKRRLAALEARKP